MPIGTATEMLNAAIWELGESEEKEEEDLSSRKVSQAAGSGANHSIHLLRSYCSLQLTAARYMSHVISGKCYVWVTTQSSILLVFFSPVFSQNSPSVGRRCPVLTSNALSASGCFKGKQLCHYAQWRTVVLLVTVGTWWSEHWTDILTGLKHNSVKTSALNIS